MNCMYVQLNYEDYKGIENQLKRFNELETSHKTVDGGYHKAFRLKVSAHLTLEFMGPLVKKPLEG